MLVYGLPHTTSHYQPQPPPLRQHNIEIPLLALPTLRFFPASLPQLTTFLKKVLLRQYQPPSSTLRHHRIQIPLHALPTSRFFPASLPQFQQCFTQRLLTSNVTPTPTPPPDSPPRVTHPGYFSRLSAIILPILTNSFTQALPTSDIIPNLQALHQLKCWFTASHILLLRHYQTQPPTVRQHHIPTPFLVLPNL